MSLFFSPPSKLYRLGCDQPCWSCFFFVLFLRIVACCSEGEYSVLKTPKTPNHPNLFGHQVFLEHCVCVRERHIKFIFLRSLLCSVGVPPFPLANPSPLFVRIQNLCALFRPESKKRCAWWVWWVMVSQKKMDSGGLHKTVATLLRQTTLHPTILSK